MFRASRFIYSATNSILGMIRFEICVKDKNKIDVYDNEKILFCENCKKEYYRS